jgi:hypothetical protein
MAVPPVSPAQAAGAVRRGRALIVRQPREDDRDDPPQGEPVRPASSPRGPAAPVGAQLLGERQRRGLRAGPAVLEQARSTYLQNEYAGPNDRRPRKGQITRTEI